MPKINEEAKEAGALILSRLKIFNEASVFMERMLEPAIRKGFGQCVKQFTREHQWQGEADVENDDCWLAPAGWKTDEESFRAWFEIHWYESGEEDYWLATLTGNGTEPGDFGFLFEPDRSCFGGAKGFNQYAKSINSDDVERLEKLGLNHQGKGTFFLPLHLDGDLMVQCWKEYGDFPHDDDVFEPLRNALNVLKESVPVFERIMRSAPS